MTWSARCRIGAPLSFAVLLLIGVPIVACAQSAAPASANMTVYRGNASRTGYTDTTISYPLSVAWRNTTTALSGNTSSPIVHDGVVFFGAGGTVYALNADTGAIKWKYPKGAPQPSGSSHSPATVADGKVFIGNDDGKLYVLDEKTGESLWQVVTGGGIRSAPIVDNGTVFFGSIDGSLYAVREDNQQPLWGGTFKTTGPITTPAAIGLGNVYFIDSNDTVYCAVETSGRLIWSVKFQSGIVGSPVINGDTLVVASDRLVYGLAPRAGATRWRASLPTGIVAQVSADATGNTLYVPTSDSSLFVLSNRGVIQQQIALPGVASGPAIITNNSIVIATKNGVISAYSTVDYHLLWQYSLSAIAPPQPFQADDNGDITAVPTAAGDSIYALDNTGTVTALRAGAPGQIGPTASLIYPTENQSVPGSQVPYQISVTDMASGINPSTLVLKVDKTPLAVEYVAGDDEIEVKQSGQGQLFGTAPVKLGTLTGGAHTLSLSITDWRGNTLEKSWRFSVDPALDAPGSSPEVDTNVAPTQSNRQDDSANGQASAQIGGFTGAANGGFNRSNTAAGGSSGSNTNRSGGIRHAQGAPRPAPVAPPNTGGNFPPPPPI